MITLMDNYVTGTLSDYSDNPALQTFRGYY
ncbi:hypothetical protein BA1DRAFT_02324 [Photorhabdus aegyptia]|uniref:Uncharacterized protein n=1 Tax=Photorhabdus aegyptia TaxID=2805098 RepID=A0A022PJN6_9GAMM|nr:hypothetical protein BA1DRAFT_02324 [Photorhabdus aegyptia]